MRINIAVCDDEDESLHMIQKELYHAADKLNIEIETYFYNKGKKVLDFIYNEKEDFDILFLDIDMPDISGLEVAKKLRQKKFRYHINFLFQHMNSMCLNRLNIIHFDIFEKTESKKN